MISLVMTLSWCVPLFGFAILASVFSPHVIDWIMAAIDSA